MSDASAPPPATPRAIFVSYSHDDAAAARRIAATLRDAGLEVWFDENELRSGDTWDAKIKQQIRDCALFLPVISQNTQRRREGYFRLEWHLAEERSRLIARGTPFLVPVAVDDVAERGALVPEVFLSVQWTRLRGGEATAGFVERVKHLLFGENVSQVADRAPAPRASQEPNVGRRVPAAAWIGIAAVCAIAVASFFALRPSPNAGAGTRPPTAEKPVTAAPSAVAPAGPRLGPKSIAVLPFENLSEDKDANAFFADGMHEDLITNLLLIRELRCVPRTTAMSFRGTQKTLREIADELGVAYVLTGTVRRADKRMRLTGTLINPRTDETLWSKPYNKELTDVFAIQAELAQAIAGELKAVFSPDEKKLVEHRPTANPEAYDLLLKARETAHRRGATANSLLEQEGLLERAVTTDPQFGLAWARLAQVSSHLYGATYSMTQVRLERARHALTEAGKLIPDSVDYLLARGGYIYWIEADFLKAADSFRRAAELSPGSPEPRFGITSLQRRQGRWQQCLQGLYEVERLDPANPQYAQAIFEVALAGRRYGEAGDALRRAEKLGREGQEFNHLLLAFLARGKVPENVASVRAGANFKRELELMCGQPLNLTRSGSATQEAFVLAAKGDIAGARALLEAPGAVDYRMKPEREPGNGAAWANSAVREALLGNREEALRRMKRSLEKTESIGDAWTAPLMRMNLMTVMAWTGDQEGSLQECTRLVNTPMPRTYNDPWMRMNIYAMRHHPAFAPLRGDPRFEPLVNDPKNNAPLF